MTSSSRAPPCSIAPTRPRCTAARGSVAEDRDPPGVRADQTEDELVRGWTCRRRWGPARRRSRRRPRTGRGRGRRAPGRRTWTVRASSTAVALVAISRVCGHWARPAHDRCHDARMTSVTRAGVAAGHRTTAEAGAEILERGGNAVDAAVAMMLVSCAAETIFTGLGGGGFATVYDAVTGQVRCVDFFVSVPGLGGKRPGTGDGDRGDLRRPADAVRDRRRHGRRAGHPGRGRPPVAALGPAAVGRGGRARACRRRTAPRSRRPTPGCCPGSRRRWCVGDGVDVYRRPDGQLPAGRRPAAAPRPPQGVRAADDRPRRLLLRRVRRRPARRGGRRRRDRARRTWTPTGWWRPPRAPVAVDRLHRARPRRRPRRLPARTMATAARAMPGDPLTDPASARGLVRGAPGPGQARPRPPTSWRSTTRATAA